MAIAVTPNERVEYILKADREDENPTKWYIRHLTSTETAHLQDQNIRVTADEEARLCPGKMGLDAIRAGLVGWENFADEKGNLVEYADDKIMRTVLGRKRKTIDPKLIDCINPDDLGELSDEIIERTKVSDEQTKN